MSKIKRQYPVGSRVVELKGYQSEAAGTVSGYGVCNGIPAPIVDFDNGVRRFASPELLSLPEVRERRLNEIVRRYKTAA